MASTSHEAGRDPPLQCESSDIGSLETMAATNQNYRTRSTVAKKTSLMESPITLVFIVLIEMLCYVCLVSSS